jgi:hypothetical protein
LDFRNRINKQYAVLFGENEEQNPYSENVQFSKQWGWYSSIYHVAQGDIRRFDEVTALGLHQCLTFLTFEQQKSRIEVNQLKKSHEKLL